MSACTATCKKCCSFQSPEILQSLAVSRREELLSLFRNNASSINDITDSSVTSMAQQDLQRCLSQIQQCEKEKKRLDGLLLLLGNQKVALERIQEDCKSLSAPIRKIPAELLRNIFVFLEAESEIGGDNPVVEGFRVAAVCHHWCTVAPSTNSLWNTIILQTHLPDDSLQLTVLDRLFKLSGRQPLDIDVVSPVPKLDSQMVARLLQQSDRWARAAFANYYPDLLDNQPSLSFASLQHLEIHLNSRFCHWPQTPKLHSLTLSGGSGTNWATIPNFSLPANNLGATISHLILEYIPLNFVLQFISRSPSLMSVTIEYCQVQTFQSIPLVACNSSVTTLSIFDCSTSVVEALFEHLQCPQLISLDVHHTDVRYERVKQETAKFPDLAFISMLRRTDRSL
ncbi:hypothetical protein C8J56DRAFT_382463 [Mycena floridula]|nr:hypothetical protein C8J56DRAFT_382463 [Mycena floridula]